MEGRAPPSLVSEGRCTRQRWGRRSSALQIFTCSPKRIKQSTVGRGAAGKDQVAFMVRALLGLTETPDADAADALAIGLTHLRSQEVASLGVPGATRI